MSAELIRKLHNGEAITLEDLAATDPTFERPDYSEILLRLSVLMLDLSKRLNDMRIKSTGAIAETRERVKLSNAIKAVRKAARDLQS